LFFRIWTIYDVICEQHYCSVNRDTVDRCLQVDASFMAALPDDIRDEIESAYSRDCVTNPSSSNAMSPDKSLHPLMRSEVCCLALLVIMLSFEALCGMFV